MKSRKAQEEAVRRLVGKRADEIIIRDFCVITEREYRDIHQRGEKCDPASRGHERDPIDENG